MTKAKFLLYLFPIFLKDYRDLFLNENFYFAFFQIDLLYLFFICFYHLSHSNYFMLLFSFLLLFILNLIKDQHLIFAYLNYFVYLYFRLQLIFLLDIYLYFKELLIFMQKYFFISLLQNLKFYEID